MDLVYVLEGKTFFSPDDTELWLTIETTDRQTGSYRVMPQSARTRNDFGTDAVKLVDAEQAHAAATGDLGRLLAFARAGCCKISLILTANLLNGVSELHSRAAFLPGQHVLPVGAGRGARPRRRRAHGHRVALPLDRALLRVDPRLRTLPLRTRKSAPLTRSATKCRSPSTARWWSTWCARPSSSSTRTRSAA